MATDIIASTDGLSQLLRRLADRDRVRSEATVQADVRQLLLTGGLGLGDHDLDVQLEAQVGDRRRIDVEVGFTVIEVKKDLRNVATVRAAEDQLSGEKTWRLPIDLHSYLSRLHNIELAAMNDPTGLGSRFTAYSSDSNRNDALSKLGTAVTRARKARELDDAQRHGEAIAQYKLLFNQ